MWYVLSCLRESCCHHYIFQSAARVLLYAPSHRHHHHLCYTGHEVVAGTIAQWVHPEGVISHPIAWSMAEMVYLMTHSTHLCLYAIRENVLSAINNKSLFMSWCKKLKMAKYSEQIFLAHWYPPLSHPHSPLKNPRQYVTKNHGWFFL